jgi:hypothetical protein
MFTKKVYTPEYLGEEKKDFNFITEYLKDRGIVFNVK